MKVLNHTLWRTDHLRAIFQKAAAVELEPAKRKALVVTVTYTRGGRSSGCAVVGGRHATIRVRHPNSRDARYIQVGHDDPRPMVCLWRNPDGTEGKVVKDDSPRALDPVAHRELVLAVASVAVHEFAHIRGMQHATMPSYYKWHGAKWREYVAWAADLPLDVQPPKVRRVPAVEDKLAHVLKMKARAVTRVKRATTLLKGWQRRERYYRKQVALAAQKVRPP